MTETVDSGSLRAWMVLRWGLVGLFTMFAFGRADGCGPISVWEQWAYDAIVVPALPAAPTSDRIVIVTIDEAALRDVNERWPLSRTTWARFIDQASQHDPAVIALDVLFDQAHTSDALELAEMVLEVADRPEHRATPAAEAVRAYVERQLPRYDADRALLGALANSGRVILGAVGTTRRAPLDLHDHTKQWSPVREAPDAPALTAEDVVMAHPRLTLAALGSGVMNTLPDADGVVRRYAYVIGLPGGSETAVAYPSLALAAIQAVPQHGDHLATLLAKDDGAPRLVFRGGSDPFPAVSFSDILYGTVPDRSILEGKILFVGASAYGIEDFIRTPRSATTPGVSLHATAAENLLMGTYVQVGGLATWLALLEVFVLLGAFVVAATRFPRARRVLAVALAVLALHAGVVVAAGSSGLLIAALAVPMGLAALGGLEVGARWQSQRRAQRALIQRQRVLEAQKDAREGLMSTVNHELRTPLTSILGSLKLVSGGVVGELPKEASELVEIASRNSDRLLALVNDLLDLNKIESGGLTFDLRPVPLAPIVEEAVTATRGFANTWHVSLNVAANVPPDVLVNAAADRLGQVITNLLSNAIKHSPQGDSVTVQAHVTADGVRVSVRDRGPGIPREARPHLFEKFVMTAAGDGHKRPGTGLGLAIAKAIIEDHAGRIDFESEIGAGSTFYFDLPRHQP